MLIGQVRGLFERLARSAGRVDGPRSEHGSRGEGTTDRTTESDAGGGDPDSELVTSAEQILDVVNEKGGRIEQAEVVSTLSCSAATVSRRLAELEDDGDVVRYKVGRKKVVCLPDEIDVPGGVGESESESTTRPPSPPAA